MYRHEPTDYQCPFCIFLKGGEDAYATQADIIYKDQLTSAIIAPRWWPANPGGVLVIPNRHFENVYGISDEYIDAVYRTVKRIATTIREVYGCEGVSTRQHNEPAGGQDVWHFHVQVLPRYDGDQLYERNNEARFVQAIERRPYAEKLRSSLNDERH